MIDAVTRFPAEILENVRELLHEWTGESRYEKKDEFNKKNLADAVPLLPGWHCFME